MASAQHNLRTNYLPRESTRLRVVAASAPADLEAYERHISNLESALVNATGVENDLSDALTRIARSIPCFPNTSTRLLQCTVTNPMLATPKFWSKSLTSTSWTRDLIRRITRREIHRLTNRDLMRLGHVCAYWRVLVLETPAFWRALDLDLKFWSPKMLPLVQTRLERSGNSSLLMRLGAPETVAVDDSLLQMVAQHSSRWHAALFYMDFASYSALSPYIGNLPLLECLFANAPYLRDVTYIGPAKALKSLPWSQIQRFEYLYLHSLELTGLELRRLMYHQVVIIALDDLAQIMNPQPMVSQLTRLTVEYALHFYGAINDVLKRLTLPSLTCLEFVVWQYNEMPPLRWDQPAFHEFCVRSNSHQTLTTLFIQHVALTPAAALCHPRRPRCPHELGTPQALRRQLNGSDSQPIVFWLLVPRALRRGSIPRRELKSEVLMELAKLTQEKGFIGSIQVADEVEMYTFFY
ncbi:F-box domain-containing protein [Favolaschia claudopus]|uniref:F-box domain-containing protein n=1 Tax=Favolaschia claudopus TaxID=2862362 RepID=A0AAW0AJ93_9AGAR